MLSVMVKGCLRYGANGDLVDEKCGYPHLHIIHNTNVCFNINVFKIRLQHHSKHHNIGMLMHMWH